MKKFNILRILSILTISVAGVFGAANLKSIKKALSVGAWNWEGTHCVLGTFNNWSTTANPLVESDSTHASCIMYMNSGNYEFKIQLNSKWLSMNNYGWHKDWSGSTNVYEGNGNMTLNANASDSRVEATFSVVLSGNDASLSVSQKAAYTLTFDSDGGSSVASIERGSGASIAKPSNPTKSGSTFAGWYDGNTAVSWPYNLTSNKTLTAHWTINSYTITYDRNLNDGGATASQTKYPSTSVTAYTPGTSPLNTARWNPSAFKRFKYWNTGWGDDGDRVNAGAAITSNANFTLYYIEDWLDYRYRIDSGSWVNLVQNNTGKGDSVKVQFAPSTAQTLPLHGKIYFQSSDDGGSNWSDLNSVTFEGNYNTTTGIELATIDTIYLKCNNNGTYSCWVPGISERTICVFDSSSATEGGTPYTMRGNGNDETVTTMDVYIKKGQFVKRGSYGNYTYGSIFAGGTGTAASCFSQVGSDTAVECTKTGVYTVYNQRGSYDNWKDIYFTRNEEGSASFLSQIFNDIIEAICDDIVGGTKTLTNLQAVWGSNSSSTLYNHFNGQITATMNFFKTSASTSDAEILECVARYDYIVKKYGTTALPDFLIRNNGYTAAPQGSRVLLAVNQNTNYVMLISVISLVSVGAVGGYFFYKKRKENN